MDWSWDWLEGWNEEVTMDWIMFEEGQLVLRTEHLQLYKANIDQWGMFGFP